MPRYDFQPDFLNLDVNRDEYLLPWIEKEGPSPKLLVEEIEKVRPSQDAA